MSLRAGGYSKFENNTSTGHGGVLYAALEASVTIDGNSTLKDNIALLEGGAFFSGSHLQLLATDSAALLRNIAEKGGLAYSIGPMEISLMGKANVTEQSAQQGGVAYSEATTSLFITGAPTLWKNYAAISGIE